MNQRVEGLAGAGIGELDLPGLPEGTSLELTVARDGVPVSGGDGSIHAGLQIAELPAWLRALTELPALVASLATVAALEHLDVDLASTGIGFTILDLSLSPLVGSALLFVVAQVFSYGRRLTEDVEGLV